MSDQISAHIYIGGSLSHELIPGLLGAINADGLKSEWGGSLSPQTAEQLQQQAELP